MDKQNQSPSPSSQKTTIVLGTMTFGMQVAEKDADRIIGLFLDAGHEELDTAGSYGDGVVEEMLGRLLTAPGRKRLKLATKVNPWASGGLTPQSVIRQMDASLKRLKCERVDLLYLHAPDHRTPVAQTLEAIATLFGQGKFRRFGLSNYAAWQVVDIFQYCRATGLPLPVIYQGVCNAVNRGVESELLPALNSLQIGFYAYNPLAGGLLSGKYKGVGELPKKGRFATAELGRMYTDRYWNAIHFSSLDVIRKSCDGLGIPMAEACYRWLCQWAPLKEMKMSGIVLGGSTVDQIKSNLQYCAAPKLPAEAFKGFEAAWDQLKPKCASYFR